MTQDGNEHTAIVAQASVRQTVRAEAKAATGPVEPHTPSPELSRILRVVPVIQTQTQQGLTLTVVSLESYADACTVRFLAQIPRVAYTQFQQVFRLAAAPGDHCGRDSGLVRLSSTFPNQAT